MNVVDRFILSAVVGMKALVEHFESGSEIAPRQHVLELKDKPNETATAAEPVKPAKAAKSAKVTEDTSKVEVANPEPAQKIADTDALRAEAKALVIKLAGAKGREVAVATLQAAQAGAANVVQLTDNNLESFVNAAKKAMG